MSINNFTEAQAAQEAAEAKAQQDELNARAWYQILARYALVDNQANYGIIRDWCGGDITLEGFEALVRTSPQSLNMSSREKLIDDIVANSHGSQNDLRSLRLRLSTFSLKQLREKRRTIDFKATVQTRDQAKNFVASQRDTEIGWKNSGYPKLQSTIVPSGQIHAVPTGHFLREIAKNDFWLFKRYVKNYSADQCNYWMNQ